MNYEPNSDYGTTPAQTRKSDIPMSLEELRANLSMLQDSIEALEARLSPVIRTSVPVDERKSNEAVAREIVPLALELVSMSREVQRCNGRISGIINRLEL